MAASGESLSKAAWIGSKDKAAEISVFFALITAIIAAMLLLILESARIQGSRLYMTVAANSSIDSLFSQYHRKLWDEYRMLGLEHYATYQLSDEMSGFIRPYFEADNMYPMKLDEISVKDMRLLTEDNAEHYEKEIIDYMHYGIAATVMSLLEADDIELNIREGSSVDGLSDIYEGHGREAMRLEESIEDIGECLADISDHAKRADACLRAYNGRAFISEARQMQKLSGKIPDLVEKYVRQAERMEAGLAASRSKLDAELDNGNISQSAWEAIDNDIAEYESYVSEDGMRRSEISGFGERADRNIELLDEFIEEAEEIEEYIEDWEPEDEDDELDKESLWAPVMSHFHSFDEISIGSKYGIQDKETEAKLEDVKTLINGELLKLVMPAGARLDTEVYDMGERPSDTSFSEANSLSAPVTDRIYIAEYTASFMDYFGRGSYDTDSKQTGSGRNEIEYILFGRDNDTDNLNEAVSKLVKIRSGLNLIYLYRDSVKKNEARSLAISITGAAGLTPLVTVVSFMIMSIWALAQAVCDIKLLLAGGKVALMHDSESFTLSLSGLLSFSEVLSNSEPDKKGGGFKYIDYLKMLLFFDQDTKQDYRSMDIMQMNMRRTQPDFLMNRLVYSLGAEVKLHSGHVFSRLGIVRAQGTDAGDTYDMKVSTAYSY